MVNLIGLAAVTAHQVNDGDRHADDEAKRSGSEHEPEAPAELEGQDHVLKVNKQGPLGDHQVVELKMGKRNVKLVGLRQV